MSTRSKLSYFVRTALGSLWRAPFVHLIAVASVGLALVGFGVARLAQAQLDTLVHSLGGDVEFTVYVQEHTPPEKMEALRVALAARTQGTATLVDPKTALHRLASELNDKSLERADLGENPLPYSIELQLPPAGREPAALRALAEKVRQLEFVDSVDYGEQALERLSVIANALKVAGFIVFALVFLTAVIVVSATLQLAIFSRREEIEIQKLVGATDRFVRLPFLIEGLLQGLMAAGLGFGAVRGLVHVLETRKSEVITFLASSGHLTVDWTRLGLEQLACGVALGLLGSFVAVRRFLRV